MKDKWRRTYYATRKIMAPHLAACALISNSSEMPVIAFEYKLVLKFMETCTMKITVRMVCRQEE
jgi:hypothetical protein